MMIHNCNGMEQQGLATILAFILILFVHVRNLCDTKLNLKIEINNLKTKLNKSQFENL